MAHKRLDKQTCPACGVDNDIELRQCGSCGEPLELVGQPKKMQRGFSITWLGIAIGVQALLTAAILIALPSAVSALDLEGYRGMFMAVPVWFVGGVLVGLISPGKTFLEPLAGAVVVAVPTALFLYNGLFGSLGVGQTVRTMPIYMYLIMASIGVMFALVGAYVGERLQLGQEAA